MKSGPVILWNPQLDFVIKIKASGGHSFQDSSFETNRFFSTLCHVLYLSSFRFSQLRQNQSSDDDPLKGSLDKTISRVLSNQFLWFSVQQEADTQEVEKAGVVRVQKSFQVCLLILFGEPVSYTKESAPGVSDCIYHTSSLQTHPESQTNGLFF